MCELSQQKDIINDFLLKGFFFIYKKNQLVKAMKVGKYDFNFKQ